MKEFIRKHGISMVFLLTLVLAVYLPFINNTFVADDDLGIVLNKDLGNIRVVWQHPLFATKPLLDFFIFKLGGIQPFFFRFSSIFFHVGTTVLIYILILLLSSELLALVAASLFAVHPVLTEAVTWISAGGYPLYSFFLLLSLVVYIVWFRRQKRAAFVLSVVCFLLSASISEKALVLVPLVGLYHFAFTPPKQWRRKKILMSFLPFFGIALAYGSIVIAGIQGRANAFTTDFYQKVTAYNPFFQIPVAITYYLQLVVWPAILTLYHSEVIGVPEYIVRVVMTLVFFTILAIAYKKNRLLFFGLGFFLIAISVTLNPLGLSSLFAERYMYLGSIGLFFAAAIVLEKIGRWLKNGLIKAVAFGVILLLLSLRTYVRNNDWKTHESFWLAEVKNSPYSFQTHYNVGTIYMRQAKYKEAILELEKTATLAPNYADVYQDLAANYHSLHQLRQALTMYLQAVKLNPKLWKSLQNIGGIYYQAGKVELAKDYTLKAIAVNPKAPELYINLGVIYLRLNEKKSAQDAFQRAVLLAPDNQIAQQGLKRAKEEH
ncbi:tetratricopeptide repeat protein [Candidatus Roizmanbacteria bacterium]|nr:tetratricopeptide repeat protein [Candidatus Roizmanbacteria bacterium]